MYVSMSEGSKEYRNGKTHEIKEHKELVLQYLQKATMISTVLIPNTAG